MVKNLKHSIKVPKRDVVLSHLYVLLYNNAVVYSDESKYGVYARIDAMLQDHTYLFEYFSILCVNKIKI